MSEKTEREMLTEAAQRLGVLIAEFTTDQTITIDAWHEIRVRFDEDGNITDFDTNT